VNKNKCKKKQKNTKVAPELVKFFDLLVQIDKREKVVKTG